MDYDIVESLILCCFILITITVFVIAIILNNFYQDYKCSTTSDINYYIKSNCERFNK